MEAIADVLVSILVLLNWATLLQASRVCKSWRSVISSPGFRAEWRKRHGSPPSLLLITAYNFSWFDNPRPQQLLVWSPGEEPSSPLLPLPEWMKISLPPNTFDIVASSHGLVAARHPSWSDDHTPGAEFTVGNPVTNEWVRIPRLKHQKHLSRLFTLTVDPASGEFGLLDWCNERMYESSSRSWVRFRAPDGLSSPKVLDIARRKQVRLREPIRCGKGIKGSPILVGCACFVWEHRGKHYMGQAMGDSDGRYPFCRVWCMEPELGRHSVKYRELASCQIIDEGDESGSFYYDETRAFECQAEGNLVCFTSQCREFYDSCIYDFERTHYFGKLEPSQVAKHADAMQPFVYDLDKRQWFRVPALRGLHMRRVVVYHPSAVRPSGWSGSNPKFGDGELLWHKRKREDQPDIATIRKRRQASISAFDKEVEGVIEEVEDIFYL